MLKYNGNSSREYLDSVGLSNLEENDLDQFMDINGGILMLII